MEVCEAEVKVATFEDEPLAPAEEVTLEVGMAAGLARFFFLFREGLSGKKSSELPWSDIVSWSFANNWKWKNIQALIE